MLAGGSDGPGRRDLAHDRRTQARRRLIIGAGSLLAHLSMLLALVSVQPAPPRAVESDPITVELVALPPPPPVVKPPDPAPPTPEPPAPPTPEPPKPAPKKPPPPRIVARAPKTPPPPSIDSLLANVGPTASEEPGFAEVSEGELASAASAGSGMPGGACNMARRIQAALRRDAMVRSALAETGRGKAIRVWNGDWVRHPGQEGNGLAVVREAMMWEIGFAPEACRRERVRGLVLFTLADGPGSTRLVVGHGDWRWSDLLLIRRASR
jgi:hypothetical protein